MHHEYNIHVCYNTTVTAIDIFKMHNGSISSSRVLSLLHPDGAATSQLSITAHLSSSFHLPQMDVCNCVVYK